MKRLLIVFTTLLLVFTLSSCRDKYLYECNEIDGVFMPFFDIDNDVYKHDINKLNVCNDTIDDLKTGKEKVHSLLNRVDDKIEDINPDLHNYYEFKNYHSNSRLYKEDLKAYNNVNAYIQMEELYFLYEVSFNLQVFLTYYIDPVEGELNESKYSEEFYKMRFYVTDDYLYYVQYHTVSGSQFTISRLHFDDEDNLIFDEFAYFHDDVFDHYQYISYQEGVGGIKALLKESPENDGILEYTELDIINETLIDFQLSNYANSVKRVLYVDKSTMSVINYLNDNNVITSSFDMYDNESFIYGVNKSDTSDIRLNIKHIDGWDYYFQNNLYKDEEEILSDTTVEVYKHFSLDNDNYQTTNQHFELVVHDIENNSLPSGLVATYNEYDEMLIQHDNKVVLVEGLINDYLPNRELNKDISLLEVWDSLVFWELIKFIKK